MRLYFSLGMAWLLAAPVLAQTAPTSPGRQRAANRQALQDARRTEAPYKDSHLAVTRRQLRRGSPAAAPLPTDAPRLRRDGSPRTGLRLPGLRRKASAEPAP